MTLTAHRRHDMIEALTSSIGKDAAMTLADHLPPVGWADVATKSDLEHLATRADLAELRGELRRETAELEVRLTDKLTAQTRILYLSIVTTVATIIGMGIVTG